MGRQMTVGTRIALGFATLILIMVALGGMAAWNMRSAKVESVKLADEYVPEVKVATALRGAANRVMYEMRGYAMTDEHSFYEAAEEELEAVDRHLGEARDLAEEAVHLEALRGHVEEAQSAVDEYEKLAEETVKTNERIEQNRHELDAAAAEYMENAASLLEHQNEMMREELGGSGGTAHGTGQGASPAAAATHETASYAGSVTAQACPAADEVIAQLKQGNERFATGKLVKPHADQARRSETATGGQHPRSTIVACSDSRVPVEALFDQGVGDIFSLRVAGNVCAVNELGSVEYGVDHLETPLLVILGHTQCGAVTATATGATVHGSIPALLEHIQPSVAKVRGANPSLHGESLVNQCVVENVWYSIEQVLTRSRAVQERAKAGKVRVVGAIYNIEHGTVDWLGTHPRQSQLLAMPVEEPAHGQVASAAEPGIGFGKHLERLEKITLVNDLIDLGNATRVACFKSQALRDPELIRAANENFKAMEEKFAALRKIIHLKEDIERIEKIAEGANRYEHAMNGLLENWLHLQELGGQREEAGQAVIEACKTTADAGLTNTDRIATEAAASLGTSTTIMVVGLAVGTIIAVLVALYIARSITGPLNRAVDSLSSGAEQVTSAAGQVSQSSQSLAEGASEQASSLEETSASLEEITSMTRQNTENSTQAKTLAAQAQSDAETGNDAMGRMSQAIDEIKKSADETAGIVKTIEEIAFQTNLLALNAAVEAARAGDAGKGFAVVAEEVRNLAQRAAEAARNTGELITGSVKNAENGVAISREVAESLAKIAEGSAKVNQIASEVAAAGHEQLQGIEQVNTAVSQMDQVTQQNAANSEEGASAAEELTAQAQEMMKVVDELAGLVGAASGNGNGKAALGLSRKHSMSGSARRSLPAPAPAQGKRAPAATRAASTQDVVKPEQVIPLDDEDMDDF